MSGGERAGAGSGKPRSWWVLAIAVRFAAPHALAQAPDAGVVGGGPGPHQALPMDEQLRIVDSMIGARPSLLPPQGVDPDYLRGDPRSAGQAQRPNLIELGVLLEPVPRRSVRDA